MPPSAITPIPVMVMIKGILKMTIPMNTPIILNITSLRMIRLLVMLPNWVIKIKKIIPSAMIIALTRKAIVSAWSSRSPVKFTSTPLGSLKVFKAAPILAKTSFAVWPEVTSDESVITLLRFLRLIPP